MYLVGDTELEIFNRKGISKQSWLDERTPNASGSLKKSRVRFPHVAVVIPTKAGLSQSNISNKAGEIGILIPHSILFVRSSSTTWGKVKRLLFSINFTKAIGDAGEEQTFRGHVIFPTYTIWEV